MPDDGSNVGHIEPQDADDALVEALEEGARETVGDSNDNGNGEQGPHGRAGGGSHASRMAGRSRRHPQPTRLATASRRSRELGEETEKADHNGSKRLDQRQASPFQRGSPA